MSWSVLEFEFDWDEEGSVGCLPLAVDVDVDGLAKKLAILCWPAFPFLSFILAFFVELVGSGTSLRFVAVVEAEVEFEVVAEGRSD